MLYCNTWENVAYILSLIAVICIIVVNGFTIYGILMNYRRLSDYQSLIVAQSSIYIADALLDFLVNEVSVSSFPLVWFSLP